MSTETEFRLEITEQVIYDACKMTRPGFVTYYREACDLPIGSKDEVSKINKIYDTLREKVTSGDLEVNKMLEQSDLNALRIKKNIDPMTGKKSVNPRRAEKLKEEIAEQKEEVVVDTEEVEVKHENEVGTEVESVEKKPSTSQKQDRTSQVRELFKGGMTSAAKIAKELGMNPSYVHRLLSKVKKEVVTEND